jgi:protein-tyrosine phosphatase
MRQVAPTIDADSFTFLFVCTGNICRSPLAERLLASRLAIVDASDRGLIQIESAGLQTVNGVPMDETAAGQALRMGAEPRGSLSRSLDRNISMHSDLILTMTRAQQIDLVKRYPAVLRRTFPVREFSRILDGSPEISKNEKSIARRSAAIVAHASAVRTGFATKPIDDDIPDPFRQDDVVHRRVADMIEDAVSIISLRMFAR